MIDDLISRKAVLDEMMAHQHSKDFCIEHHIDYSIDSGMMRIILNSAPAPLIDSGVQGIIEAIVDLGEVKCKHPGSCLFCRYEEFCKAFKGIYLLAKDIQTSEAIRTSEVTEEVKDASSN
jgi:hypothetical protein